MLKTVFSDALRISFTWLFCAICFHPSGFSQTTSELPDGVLPILTADDAYEVRKLMIRSAQKEILASYFSVNDGAKSLHFIPLLRDAARRGVKVKLVLDEFSSNVPDAWKGFLYASGIELKYFNPKRLKNLLRLNHRTHEKFIIIDGEFLLVGGRNIRDEYFTGELKTRSTFFDFDLLLKGEVAEKAKIYFDHQWAESKWLETAKKIRGVNHLEALEPLHVSNDLSRDELRETAFDFIPTVRIPEALIAAEKAVEKELSGPIDVTLLSKMIPSGCVDFYANLPVRSVKTERLEQVYEREIQNAKISIQLENPYVILTPRLKRAIREARTRGVKVEILTNSLQSIDIPLSYAAYLNGRGSLLKQGVEVYEFYYNQTLHGKIGVFDGKRAIVGSFNLDPRSANINAEDLVLLEDENAVREIQVYFEYARGISTRIGGDGIPVGSTEKFPGISPRLQFKVKILRATLARILRSQT
jgi:cardiolipin synthase C